VLIDPVLQTRLTGVRFAPKSIELPHHRDMMRWAHSAHVLQKAVRSTGPMNCMAGKAPEFFINS
jgi:hypothetical protein